MESTKGMQTDGIQTQNYQESACIFSEFYAPVNHSDDLRTVPQFHTHSVHIPDLTNNPSWHKHILSGSVPIIQTNAMGYSRSCWKALL